MLTSETFDHFCGILPRANVSRTSNRVGVRGICVTVYVSRTLDESAERRATASYDPQVKVLLLMYTTTKCRVTNNDSADFGSIASGALVPALSKGESRVTSCGSAVAAAVAVVAGVAGASRTASGSSTSARQAEAAVVQTSAGAGGGAGGAQSDIHHRIPAPLCMAPPLAATAGAVAMRIGSAAVDQRIVALREAVALGHAEVSGMCVYIYKLRMYTYVHTDIYSCVRVHNVYTYVHVYMYIYKYVA